MDQGEDFISTLANVLQLYMDGMDKQASSAEIDYAALSQMMADQGQYGAINHAIIGNAVEADQSGSLQSIIKNYGPSGIILNTEKAPEKKDAQPNLDKNDQGISKTTASAASAGAKSTLDKI